jgi:hypothetical protein
MKPKRTLRLRHSNRKRRISISGTAGLSECAKESWKCIKEHLSEKIFMIVEIKPFMTKEYEPPVYDSAMDELIEDGKIIELPRTKFKTRFFKVIKV